MSQEPLKRSKKLFGLRDIDSIPQLQAFSHEERFAMKVVAHVLPFRTNNYIVDELIDWDRAPEDPVFRLNFMDRAMLPERDFLSIADALIRQDSQEKITALVKRIRLGLNPHPAGQLSSNVPEWNGAPVQGIQHKYRETCLVFPSNGQTCFAYCTFCFRWPQFTDLRELKFATDESQRFLEYIRRNQGITDVLITGGDPLVMHARILERYILPLLGPGFEHIQSIRIGTKMLGHWPFRFLSDPDAEDLLRLFEKVVASGKQLAFMAHFSHNVELSTPAAQEAIRRIRRTGAMIRSQSPLIRRVNDSAAVWSSMWKEQVRQGIVPYYMFVERDTGPRHYFEVPLYRTLKIYRDAIQRVSGLARTVRGPSMSTFPGKVVLEGTAEIHNEKVFVLNFLQARQPDWIKRPFFARYDETASWLDDLQPALGESKFFFEDDLEDLLQRDTVESA